jgi:hypothetical protein
MLAFTSMNERTSLRLEAIRKGSSIQKLPLVRLCLLCACWLTISGFAAALSARANFHSETEFSGRIDRVADQGPATQASFTLVSTAAGTQTINATAPQSPLKPLTRAAILYSPSESGIGLQMVGGLALLLWIQRLRRYWV